MVGVGLHVDDLLPHRGVGCARAVHVHALAHAVAVGVVKTRIGAEIGMHVGGVGVDGVRAFLPDNPPRVGVGGIVAVTAREPGVTALKTAVGDNIAVNVTSCDVISCRLRRGNDLVAVVRIGERRLRHPGVLEQVVRVQRHRLADENGGVLREKDRLAVVGLRGNHERNRRQKAQKGIFPEHSGETSKNGAKIMFFFHRAKRIILYFCRF